ncbi:MAG: AAC(3) family N-acetyltransferase [Anaerolineales bacterium]|nr:AAC(3) family N-acetyltransferase [Anaerolineales bacterium]
MEIPLTPSRVIMVHSSFKSLGEVEGGAEAVIDALLAWIGPEGTVLFPNFNFESWTETHYFDVIETPSRMGIVGELARVRPGAVRTPHPIYSFVAFGKRKDEFGACEDMEAYGPNSVFALFHKLNGVIVSIGLEYNSSFSMIHYVEYNAGCDHRRLKKFSGIYIGYDGKPEMRTYSMYVRKNNNVTTDINPAMEDLIAAGAVKAVQAGDTKVEYATAMDFYDNMSVIVCEHPEKVRKLKQSRF